MGNKSGKLTGAGSSGGPLGPTRKGTLIRSVLQVILDELVRLAETSVEQGNPFYSVAILRKSDLSVLVGGRDETKTKDPTATAELNAIRGFYTLDSTTRPTTVECIFLCVHEPSSLALYQIAQCGFDNFVFLFSREESKAFGADGSPVTLNEIFTGATENEEYNRENSYWTAFSLGELIEKSDKKEGHMDLVATIKERYTDMMQTETAPLAPQTPSKGVTCT